MRVVDITEFYSVRGGGVRSHLTLKSHVLCQLGHTPRIIAPGPTDTVSEKDSTLHVGGPPLPYDPSYHLLWRVDKARRLIARERPDVLEIHSPYAAAVAALSVPRSAFGIRTFVWHADFIDTTVGIAARKGPLAARVVRSALEPAWGWVRTIARACDATFAASRWQTDKLRAHDVARVEHLPFGVEKEVFRPEARSEARRAELLAGREGPLFVAIGRFAVEKRWDVVLDAFLARGPGRGALVVLGDGPDRAAMEARVAARRGDVTFLGFDKDRARLASALASGDVLLHGCPFETFGLGVAEAVACGLPLVAPDEGGAAEQAEAAGASAIAYRSGDVDACVAATRALLARIERDPAAARAAAVAASARVPSVRDHFAQLVSRYQALLDARTTRGA